MKQIIKILGEERTGKIREHKMDVSNFNTPRVYLTFNGLRLTRVAVDLKFELDEMGKLKSIFVRESRFLL